MTKTPNTMENSSDSEDISGLNVQFIMPYGAAGGQSDALVEAIIRTIAEYHAHEGEWADKYGTSIDNEWFMMHPFCWCESETCPWCREEDQLPNFHYKPLDFKVSWYKYIGRSMNYNKELTPIECADMLKNCIQLP